MTKHSQTIILMLAAIVLTLLTVFAVNVLLQRSFIYYRRKYPQDVVQRALGRRVAVIEFQTSQGKQAAFLDSRNLSDSPPRRLWLMFGGNAMLALEWLDLLREFPDPSAGFLFVDYPGYGVCEGRPNPAHILESAEKAFHALQDRTHWNLGQESLGVVGWSLGAAAALQFADKQPVGQLILVAPFTTMSDLVKHVLGVPPGPLLMHRFDNVGALRRILARKPAPKVTIVHGRADTLVPITMGRALARLDPQRIRFVEIPAAGHNDVFYRAQPVVFADMASP
jgi:pimeloyl-ACP methyl ester carboxylesterase